MNASDQPSFDSRARQSLLLELANREQGVTAQEAHEIASKRGDTVSVEAYHNLGRRLAHRGLVSAERGDKQTLFRVSASAEGQWLDEENLAEIIDPEYPLIALTVLKEARRQLNDVPDEAWVEIRERLRSENAPKLFVEAIKSYADDLIAALYEYELESSADSKALPKMRAQIESSMLLLKQVCRYGLGVSQEAIMIPPTFALALALLKSRGNMPLYDEALLVDEISRRVSPESFVVNVEQKEPDRNLLVAAVDGSTRGGLLSLMGEEGDFTLGPPPSIYINTATAQINWRVKVRGQEQAAFIRLPEKPEDMQQRENRYTIMARLFFPDLTESQYAHSVWNAMNLLECRAALQVMKRWYTSRDSVEVRPADVILMDGTVAPNDRDSNHYAQMDAYGQIVRDLIEASYAILKGADDEGQVVTGVVKNAQLRVFAPVINYFMAQVVARDSNSQIQAWPLRVMNAMPDQVLLTRLLTAGRRKGDQWQRTCLALRPFHAVTDFNDRYSRQPGNLPSKVLLDRAAEARARRAAGGTSLGDVFWSDFRDERDPFVRMLDRAAYANFFLATVPRLDQRQALPRMEILTPARNVEEGSFDGSVYERVERLVSAFTTTGFDVAQEHAMFDQKGWIDVLPRLLIDVHYTVKVWATELTARIQEYVGQLVSKKIQSAGVRGIRVRKWRPAELKAWVDVMTEERRKQAGMSSGSSPPRLPDA